MKTTDLARQKIIQDILHRMTDEERRAYLIFNGQNELMSAIKEQDKKLDEISKKQSWLNDFSANIAANAAFDALVYIGAKLFKKL